LKNHLLKKLLLSCLFAGAIVICTVLSVPALVPFTMQTFAVFLSFLCLGAKFGSLSVALYLALGLVGLPVFSGFASGPVAFLGPTGGFLLGFVLLCPFFLLFEKVMAKGTFYRVLFLALGNLLLYLVGILWFLLVYSSGETSVLSALSLLVLPYLLPDAVKIFLAVFLEKQLKKFFPFS